MSNPIPAITRNIVIEYHLLGLLIIISYLLIALPTEIFWKILPMLSVVELSLIVTASILHPKRPRWNSTFSTINNQTQQFLFDLCFYLCAVLAVLLIETYGFNYAYNVIGKSAGAILGTGLYIAIGIATEVEHTRIKTNSTNISHKMGIIPSSLKLRYFLLLLLTVDWSIFTLVYFEYIGSDYYLPATIQDFQEIVFVSVVTVSLSIYLFYLYSRNFIHALGMQLNALRCVAEDNFDVSIPIVSDDELALLAGYHNTMIERLKDRKRLHRTLEKSVGANIMNKLLTTDEQTLKQGQLYSVAILFCDLRGFTSLGESASAEEVILFLNDYFADVSSVVSSYHGIINKFMGDAVLAIFGLETEGNAVEDAVNASLAIIAHNVEFYMPNELHPETGVGIDFGSVVGGTIGSEERYEYTIIGDAVNKASRLEGLSKRLSYSIILSEEAYQQLGDKTRQHFCDLGAHKVRGRNEAICVYGSGKKQKSAPTSPAGDD